MSGSLMNSRLLHGQPTVNRTPKFGSFAENSRETRGIGQINSEMDFPGALPQRLSPDHARRVNEFRLAN